MVPGQGDPLCPTGAVVLVGRGGAIRLNNPHSQWVKGTCTWCGAVVPKGRRSWCSQACVDRFKVTTVDGQHAAVEERDRGTCALCCLDTARFRVVVSRWLNVFGIDRQTGRYWPDVRRRLAQALTAHGLPTSERSVAHLWGARVIWWDMDHAIPIVDGGHPCALENLRTLCYWCHQRETSEAATRRAEERRLARATRTEPATTGPQLLIAQ